jgi:hypothetical protein
MAAMDEKCACGRKDGKKMISAKCEECNGNGGIWLQKPLDNTWESIYIYCPVCQREKFIQKGGGFWNGGYTIDGVKVG